MTLETGTLMLGKILNSRNSKRIEPKFIFVDDKWDPVDGDAFKSSSPLKAPNDLPVENSALVIAELVEESNLPGKDQKRFSLTSVRPADVVIDRRAAGPAHRIAEEIGELRFPRWANSNTKIYALCEDEVLLGPLRVVKRKAVAPSPEKLEMRDSAGMVVTDIDGYMVGDRIDRLPAVDYIDCRPLDEVVDAVAELAVSTLTGLDFAEVNIQSTKETLAKVRDWISERSSTSGDSLDTRRVQRALQACEDADATRRLASRIANTLSGLPTVVALMDQAIEEARANAERAELNQIADRVAQGTKQLADLDKGLHAAQSELQQLNNQIAHARHELNNAQEIVNARNEELRRDVAIAVEELVTGTRERLASSIIVQALTRDSAQVQAASPSSPTSINLRPVAKSPLAERNAVKKQLMAAMRATGMKGPDAQRLVAAISAGLLPITLGNGGPAALSAIAALTCSGRVLRIPVAHDFLHPADLQGLHSAKPGAFRSHHGILEAANSEAAAGEVMVVLEGINQAPTESYLVPWLQSRWEDTGFTSLGPHPNLKVAGTIATGVTSARISPDLWGYAIAVDLPTLLTWPVANEFSYIRLAESTEPTNDEVVSYLLADIEPIWPFSDDIEKAAERFAAALSPLQAEEKISGSVAECILLPVAATSLADDEYEEFVAGLARNLSLADEMALRYQNLAKRLRMRLG
ncbi:hypothetical protein [Nocardia sp. NPDC004860]|uniref:hypothetical protein n=1 Tax=Nocardia sp. NPDC004860 TaxID=3154557 RepID=UPI0033BA7BB3